MPEIFGKNPEQRDVVDEQQVSQQEILALEENSENKATASDENYKYSAEAVKEDKAVKAEKIRSWAKELGLVEGRDFIIQESIASIETDPGKIAPHENLEMAVGVKEKFYKNLKDYFEGKYAEERKKENSGNKYGGPSLNYSWGGRFAVINDGVTVNTIALNEDMSVSTHHQEFREFFKQRTGFEFPGSETLNPILRETSKTGLDTYQTALNKLEEMRDQETLPSDGYGLINEMQRLIMILRDAEAGEAVIDLPETLKEKMPDKMRHYADLTYNSEDLKNLDRVTEITGISIPEEVRIDKMFNKYNFKREAMEDICRDFSDYITAKKDLE